KLGQPPGATKKQSRDEGSFGQCSDRGRGIDKPPEAQGSRCDQVVVLTNRVLVPLHRLHISEGFTGIENCPSLLWGGLFEDRLTQLAPDLLSTFDFLKLGKQVHQGREGLLAGIRTGNHPKEPLWHQLDAGGQGG